MSLSDLQTRSAGPTYIRIYIRFGGCTSRVDHTSTPVTGSRRDAYPWSSLRI